MGRVSDWAARHGGSWWPAISGVDLTLIPYAVVTDALWAWLLALAGIIMIAIHPAGTMLRHHLGPREVCQVIRQTRGLDYPDDRPDREQLSS